MLLRELSGWAVDAETIRRLTHAAAADATRTRDDRAALPVAFAHAHGPTVERPGPTDDEVAIDAGKVNTQGGWRDVKVAVFAVRGRAEADRLGRTEPSRLSVLGEGAEWLGNLAEEQFPTAGQVLDYYHAAEYLAAAGRASVGVEGRRHGSRWLFRVREAMMGA